MVVVVAGGGAMVVNVVVVVNDSPAGNSGTISRSSGEDGVGVEVEVMDTPLVPSSAEYPIDASPSSAARMQGGHVENSKSQKKTA